MVCWSVNGCCPVKSWDSDRGFVNQVDMLTVSPEFIITLGNLTCLSHRSSLTVRSEWPAYSIEGIGNRLRWSIKAWSFLDGVTNPSSTDRRRLGRCCVHDCIIFLDLSIIEEYDGSLFMTHPGSSPCRAKCPLNYHTFRAHPRLSSGFTLRSTSFRANISNTKKLSVKSDEENHQQGNHMIWIS
jgi:hypothetical protein